MARAISPGEYQRRLRAAQRKYEHDMRQAVAKANREIDAHNRKVDAQNRKAVADYNRKVDAHNRQAERHNAQVIEGLNRQLSSPRTARVSLTAHEQQLVDRVHAALPELDSREYDVFLSYARLDGAEVAGQLRDALEQEGVSVWFDFLAIRPGKSQALQMDQGLRVARAGIALLTPAYLAGRFWTERELGALLHKATLIPVLHNVTFADVAEYSGILPDLAGFETARDDVAVIAQKIAEATRAPDAA